MPSFPTPPFVLLEDSKAAHRQKAGLLFHNPVEILECARLDEVSKMLGRIETALANGFYLAGWFSYESSFPFHPKLNKNEIPLIPEPLIWLGLFQKPEVLSTSDLDDLFSLKDFPAGNSGLLAQLTANETEQEFDQVFAAIQNYISKGDVYQINHTFRLYLKSLGQARALYSSLRRSQPVPYGAYIDTGAWQVLSLSPELFISCRDGCLISRPMKGTAKPGFGMEDNLKRMEALEQDEKNRAENLMITDLIRNDFSRICTPGTVKVSRLFEVEHFSTVLQMSSEITGELNSKTKFRDIFKALFPCGSITGAPKIRAMEIIDETEKTPRGIYTGAIGFLAPTGDFSFNVPIRTVVLDKKGEGWLGIGSGIVADSAAGEEYRECLLKADFLSRPALNFALVETLLWSADDGFHDLDKHLARLAASAAYFSFPYPGDAIQTSLKGLTEILLPADRYKFRLVLGKKGTLAITHEKIDAPSPKNPLFISLSDQRVNSLDSFLFHKTTHRPLYNEVIKAEKKRARIYDVIFQNENSELTEGTFNSLFIRKNRGPLLTPALKAGLLPGILRANLLESGEALEASLKFEDLKKAKYIYLGNSVRGLMQVNLLP